MCSHPFNQITILCRIKLFDILIALLLLTLLSSCGSGGDNNKGITETTKSSYDFVFNVLSSSGNNIPRITVKNIGTIESGLNISVNGNYLYTGIEDILSDINNLSFTYPDEPFQKLLWRYIVKYRYHFHPFTERLWAHTPVLFFNSIGFGYCDDAAALYYLLAKSSGYDSRVWGLGGHVVPEIWIKDHWEMYDPDLEVYYVNAQNQVLGVEYLADNPLVISSPNYPVLPLNYPTEPPVAYSQPVADIYGTKSDNWTNSYYHYNLQLPKYDYPLRLPPNSFIQFPAQLTYPLKSLYDYEIPSYGVIKLVLPKYWTGNINLPLIILVINGSGNITINNINYTLPSSELDNILNNRNDLINEFTVINSNSDIEVYMLVNTTRYNINNINSLEINSESPLLNISLQ